MRCGLLRTQVASSLFLTHNTALAPPYRVLIDTNFINFSLQNKLELVQGMMDCLYAKCTFSGIARLNERNPDEKCLLGLTFGQVYHV